MGKLFEVCGVGVVMLLHLLDKLRKDVIRLLYLLLEIVVKVPIHLIYLPVLCLEGGPRVIGQELEL